MTGWTGGSNARCPGAWGEEVASVEIVRGDMTEVAWETEADIIYAACVCFPETLLVSIVDKMVNLKTGARVVALRLLPDREYLKLDQCLKIRMTWGNSEAYIYNKV